MKRPFKCRTKSHRGFKGTKDIFQDVSREILEEVKVRDTKSNIELLISERKNNKNNHDWLVKVVS